LSEFRNFSHPASSKYLASNSFPLLPLPMALFFRISVSGISTSSSGTGVSTAPRGPSAGSDSPGSGFTVSSPDGPA